MVLTESILDTITCPADLRRLDRSELDLLAVELRHKVIGSVAAVGGHLGSNLGAVELSMALHLVYDSPHDLILWDTGHQAYVHKMLTGRADRFDTLRTEGGLSGYPSREESPHDWVENSHASTILSYAAGLSTADVAAGRRRRVVAVIGDGALTGGLAYEGLNNIGFRRLDVTVVVNDNGRSYAPTVSRLWDQPAAFFESLGLRYTGPVDGHDLDALTEALGRAGTGPVVVHVRTRKGRGYPPAEADPEKCLHDTSPFDPDTGRPTASKPLSFTAAFSDAVVELGERHPELVAITAAMPGSTGLLAFAERFEDRFLDVGIAEQHAVTAAAGMAMGGLRPLVAVYSTFLNRAWDQIVHDVALHRLPVIFCIDRAGVTGDDGPSHHGVLDLALLSKVPGMTVFAPSVAEEVPVMLAEAMRVTHGPVAIRWPKGAAPRGDTVGTGHRARRVVTAVGDRDVCVVAVGRMLGPAVEAAARSRLAVSVWDARVHPPDPAMIADAAGHGAVVTVEDGIVDGGLGERFAAAIREVRRDAVVATLGTPREFLAHAKPAAILSRLGLDAAGIAGAIRAAHAAVAGEVVL